MTDTATNPDERTMDLPSLAALAVKRHELIEPDVVQVTLVSHGDDATGELRVAFPRAVAMAVLPIGAWFGLDLRRIKSVE